MHQYTCLYDSLLEDGSEERWSREELFVGGVGGSVFALTLATPMDSGFERRDGGSTLGPAGSDGLLGNFLPFENVDSYEKINEPKRKRCVHAVSIQMVGGDLI